jgi:putative hydrolase of the HAD superfamily
MVRAVLFDLDDTLFDHRGCSRDALSAVQIGDDALRGVPMDALEKTHAQILEELHGDVSLGRVPLEQARLERFRRLLSMSGRAPAENVVARTAATYRDRYRQVRRAVHGARELLHALSARVRVGIVSNNLYDEQQEKLEACGLAPFVGALVVSERVGVSKPDPAIFVAALDELGCTAADAVMVGDSWTADIAGARAAGIRPIWFNPLGADTPDGQPVEQLRSLSPTAAAVELILGGGGARN